jgi:hypothetical protein
MKIPAKLIKLLPILFILFFACHPEEEQFLENDQDMMEIENFIADAEERFIDPSARIAEDLVACGVALEAPLMYGRQYEVGNVTISNTDDLLLVNYETASGITIERTMLVIVLAKKANINVKKLFFPKQYKKLIYVVNHDYGTIDYQYSIPLSDLGLDQDFVSITAIAKIRDENSKRPYRGIYTFARQLKKNNKRGGFQEFMIEYAMQHCSETEPEPEPADCEIICTSGFGVPSVDISKSYTFAELGLTDWSWGYVHEIKNEVMFRLPIKSEDLETATIVGQITVMIEGGIAYAYFQMNDGFLMNHIRLYISPELPSSGIPCNYIFSRDYFNADGTLKTLLTDTYVISNIDDFRDSNGRFYIIAYVDYCES